MALSAGKAIAPLQQATLFPLFDKALYASEGSEKDQISLRNPAFTENKSLPVHRWVPWIAGFSAGFISDCLACFIPSRFNGKTPLVLDPFAGVGTTLVEAVSQGFDAVGCEINPYAALACRVKLNASRLDSGEVLRHCEAYLQHARKPSSGGPNRIPKGFRSRIEFFSPKVQRQVSRYFQFFSAIEQAEIADVFRLAFGAVMVSFSNYTYEPSLGTRPGAGKPLIEDADVPTVIAAKLRQIAADIQAFRSSFLESEAEPGCGTIHVRNFMDSEGQIGRESVDLMVTSPPYLNNYHYIRNTRPQLFWLSFVDSSQDLKEIEDANLGKYWQTVRDKDPIELQFNHSELTAVLDRLRQIRIEKKAYGGPGWANYVATYFNDSHRFLSTLHRLLRPGSFGVIVVGNSIIQGQEIKVADFLAEIAVAQGFRQAQVECVRSKRVGNSITTSAIRKGKRSKAVLSESIVILKK